MNFGPYYHHDSTTIAGVDNLTTSSGSQSDPINTNSSQHSSITSQPLNTIIQLTTPDSLQPTIATKITYPKLSNLSLATDHNDSTTIGSVNVTNGKCNDTPVHLLDSCKAAIPVTGTIQPQQSNLTTTLPFISNKVTENVVKKQPILDSSFITNTQNQTNCTIPHTATIILASSSTGQTELNSFDSSKTTCENSKSKTKKSSKLVKRSTIHKDGTTGQSRKNGQRKKPSAVKATNQQQQRLQMLQRKRRQVWFQLLPQITAKKDRISAAKIERRQRLRLLASECQKQYSKQKNTTSVQGPHKLDSVCNTATQSFLTQSEVLSVDHSKIRETTMAKFGTSIMA
mgnify:CR=1 FL=1